MSPEGDDPPKKNIILNFLRDESGAGTYDDQDMLNNGWKVIDVTSMSDAKTKLKEYLGENKADNIYINAHGGSGTFFPGDEKVI